MIVQSTWQIVLSCIEFALFLAIMAAIIRRAFGIVNKALHKLTDPPPPSTVDMTLNQMQVHLPPDTTPYAATRNTRQSLKRGG